MEAAAIRRVMKWLTALQCLSRRSQSTPTSQHWINGRARATSVSPVFHRLLLDTALERLLRHLSMSGQMRSLIWLPQAHASHQTRQALRKQMLGGVVRKAPLFSSASVG